MIFIFDNWKEKQINKKLIIKGKKEVLQWKKAPILIPVRQFLCFSAQNAWF